MSAALAEQIHRMRMRDIENALNYQHKRDDLEQVPFMAVYRDRKQYPGFAGARPEEDLKFWLIERVIVQREDNAPVGKEGARLTCGLIILRHLTAPYVKRWKVTIQDNYASNGNLFMTTIDVQDEKEEDRELQAALEAA